MKENKHISILLVLFGILVSTSSLHAQVTASATVTLTVIPAPPMSSTPVTQQNTIAASIKNGSSSEKGGMTFRSSCNLMVQLHPKDSITKRYSLDDGQVKTFSAGELKNLSRVEVDYLGS